MAAITTCITKSATLVPGETFILPPGAEIVGVSSLVGLESGCVDLENIPTMTCYVALIGTNPRNGNLVNYYEGTGEGVGGAVKGYKYEGTDYDFSRQFNAHGSNDTESGQLDDFALLANELKSRVPAIVAVKTGIMTDSQRGVINYLFIKTIPSVAKAIEIRLHGYLTDQAYQPNEVTNYTSFRLLEDVTTAGYQMVNTANPFGGYIPLYTCDQIS